MAVVQCMHVRRYQTTYAPVSAARDAATCSCWQPANKPGVIGCGLAAAMSAVPGLEAEVVLRWRAAARGQQAAGDDY
jgi:hypothetical protein